MKDVIPEMHFYLKNFLPYKIKKEKPQKFMIVLGKLDCFTALSRQPSYNCIGCYFICSCIYCTEDGIAIFTKQIYLICLKLYEFLYVLFIVMDPSMN